MAPADDEHEQRTERHRKVVAGRVHHLQKPLIYKNRNLRTRDRHRHNDQQRQNGDSREQAQKHENAKHDLVDRNERSQLFRVRKANVCKSPRAVIIRVNELVDSFGQEDSPNQDANEQDRCWRMGLEKSLHGDYFVKGVIFPVQRTAL